LPNASNKAGLFLIDICNSKGVVIDGDKGVEYLDGRAYELVNEHPRRRVRKFAHKFAAGY
jgi:hypothetical protein